MKKTNVLMAVLIAVVAVFCWNCGQDSEKKDDVLSKFHPIPMPVPAIPGYRFPEDSATINTWISQLDTVAMYKHSWGIWTALTTPSGEKVGGDELMAFETWETPGDVFRRMKEKAQSASEDYERPRATLEVPRQFTHHSPMATKSLVAAPVSDTQNVLVTMKYDPTAAKHALENKLLDSNVLNKMIKDGVTSIKPFPNTAVALKPTYQVIRKKDLKNGLYALKIWTGPPSPDTIGYPNSLWPACVYIDPAGNGKGNGSVDSTLHTPTPQNTYNLSDFIHFKLDKKTVSLIKREGLGGNDITEGDYVILVAMHISTKEIRQWVWQTVWWAPNADTPPLPSSATIAKQRPDTSFLKGAARHYAMATAYYTVSPAQPFDGGKNIGKPLYAFNPYLEAIFNQQVFAGTVPSTLANDKGITINNNVGVRTNCMSCHGVATYQANQNSLNYVGDRYIDQNAPFFKNFLQVDFLWSVQGVASQPPKN